MDKDDCTAKLLDLVYTFLNVKERENFKETSNFYIRRRSQK